MSSNTFGTLLGNYLDHYGISFTTAGKLIGKNHSTISYYVSNKRKPRLGELPRLIDRLSIDPATATALYCALGYRPPSEYYVAPDPLILRLSSTLHKLGPEEAATLRAAIELCIRGASV